MFWNCLHLRSMHGALKTLNAWAGPPPDQWDQTFGLWGRNMNIVFKSFSDGSNMQPGLTNGEPEYMAQGLKECIK